MKKIKIAHLYYDLMNLYGENGNVRFLKKKLEDQDVNVEVFFLSLNDEIDFDKYDIFYMGHGSLDNQELVLNDILKYKDDIANAIEEGKYFIITGNALDIFGKTIQSENGSIKDALGVFEYKTKIEEFRIVGEQLYSCDLIKNDLIGFQNRNSVMSECKDNLFTIVKGTGYEPSSNKEGIYYNNFYGTYLLGPILVRNPYFTDHLVMNVCKYLNIKYNKPKINDSSYKAYEEYKKNFYGNE